MSEQETHQAPRGPNLTPAARQAAEAIDAHLRAAYAAADAIPVEDLPSRIQAFDYLGTALGARETPAYDHDGAPAVESGHPKQRWLIRRSVFAERVALVRRALDPAHGGMTQPQVAAISATSRSNIQRLLNGGAL